MTLIDSFINSWNSFLTMTEYYLIGLAVAVVIMVVMLIVLIVNVSEVNSNIKEMYARLKGEEGKEEEEGKE